jgi:SulP family sulfate permease
MRLSNYRFQDYIPKLFLCFKEGYSKKYFIDDLFAGISVGVIALPLALAFAIGSGVAPERGLFTAIVAGFLISFLGGSRVQIGGPTGAFVIVVYTIIQKHGYDGLAVATIIAGLLMILMGIARFGVFLKYIPFPVTTGFTTGIALVIFTSQIKDFFGLQIDQVPPQFLDKCLLYCIQAYTWNKWAFLIASSTLVLIFVLRRYYPKIPGAIIAIIFATTVSYIFSLPLETIESKFGEIPRVLPTPSFPTISYELIKKVFPDAITIALLGAIESLLSAVVADGMTGNRHRSNCELIAQGLANVGSIIFGGIPATGAIARTSANIRMGAKTPVAGMTHAVTLLLLMLLLAPVAAKIPLCALSAVLIYVAWNMSELGHFIEILKSQRSEALILLVTFLLTVLIDLSVAVQVGVILAAVIFVKKMTDNTSVEICRILIDENNNEAPELRDSEILFKKDIPEDVTVFEINGPFFYSVADLLSETLIRLDKTPSVFILRMQKVPLVDTTGIRALKEFQAKCKKQGIIFLLSGASEKLREKFKNTSVESAIGQDHIFSDIDSALFYAKQHVLEHTPSKHNWNI